MAFFNKLKDLAENLGDKTSDVIETNKLNSKINSEKTAASEQMKHIGEYYYGLYASGQAVAPEVLEFCAIIDTHNQAAAEAQAEIDRIKAENEAAKAAAEEAAKAAAEETARAAAAAAAAASANPAAVPVPPVSAEVLTDGPACPGCGTANAPGTRFCCECGFKLEVPAAPAAPAKRFCPDCGTEIAEGKKFCGNCGAKVE